MAGEAANMGSQPTRKRSRSALEENLDPAERASKYLKAGSHRMSLSLLGFHPDNRGKAGVHPKHAHQVAHDGTDNGVSLRRYKQVEVVKVPEEMLPWLIQNTGI